MRPLLKLLGWGLVVFMGLAIAQEWEVFDEAWFGAPPAAPPLPEAERRAASDTAHQLLRLMEHAYGSEGDTRFMERMPASPRVLEELRADVDYLRQNRRRQELSLERLDVTGIEEQGPDRVEIETREMWRVGFARSGGDGSGLRGHARLVYGRYRLARGRRGWQVEGWDPSEPWRAPRRPASPQGR